MAMGLSDTCWGVAQTRVIGQKRPGEKEIPEGKRGVLISLAESRDQRDE